VFVKAVREFANVCLQSGSGEPGVVHVVLGSFPASSLSPPPHSSTICRYYPSQIHLLSGWVHHCFYLGVLAWALHSHFSLGFCLFLPLEIPTFILAVGSIYPQRRSDWLFGMTFFITRICYHLWLFVLVREIKDPRLPVWVVIAVTFCLHIYWFGLWWKSYRRKYLLGKGGKKEGAMDGKGVAAAAGEQGNEDGGRKSKKE